MRHNLFLIACLFAVYSAFAQQPTDQLWHLLPNSKKGNSGIGLAEAQEMMKGKTPQTVIVAIADAGVDINHEDLKHMLWINADEVADNGIDDDNNGYTDDIYGWNFIGETTHDNLEITRQYALLNAKYELKATDDIENQDEYNRYLTIKQEFLQKNSDAKLYYERFLQIKQGMEFLEDSYGTDMTTEEVTNHKSKSKYEEIARGILARTAEASKNFDYLDIKTQLMSAYDHYDASYNYNYNPEFDPRTELVGDDYSNAREIGYGNNKVYYGEHSSHGTHVAGIVAADASNDEGAKGICQSCDIMSIRNVPDGDERDKDVANGIRYAVDNGAKIVNMSFGKGYSHNAEVVKEAIQYAASKGVLLVHAAGNSNQNNDISDNFPNDFNNITDNWIEVGASSWMKKPKVFAEFSNYGLEEVDIFAPGVDIYSTTPEGQYEAFNGTSMASPVVAGVAGYVWSYYPTLTAAQLKQILVESALEIKGRSRLPGSKKKTKACKISKYGSEVNLPAALRLAEKMTTGQ